MLSLILKNFKNAQQIDVLNLEWGNGDRDIYAVAPVIMELRNKGYFCVSGNIVSFFFFLLFFRPKLLFINSFSGAFINHHICKTCYHLGIKVIAAVAEGNFYGDKTSAQFWGHNKEKIEYFERVFLWNNNSKEKIIRVEPQLEPKLLVTGYSGYDRYKLLEKFPKQKFLRKFKKEQDFDFIVGLAGFGFEYSFDEDYLKKFADQLPYKEQPEQLQTMRESYYKLTEAYYELVSKNPDILFIVREHPATTDLTYSEFSKLAGLPNVINIHPKHDNVTIYQTISVCDYWGGFETTTCLEAWGLEIPTFLVNPAGKNFPRDTLLQTGSHVFTTKKELIEAFKSQLELNKLLNQSKYKSRQEYILRERFGFIDGKNHQRCAENISHYLAGEAATYSLKDFMKAAGLTYVLKMVIKNTSLYRNIRMLPPLRQDEVENAILEFIPQTVGKSKDERPIQS